MTMYILETIAAVLSLIYYVLSKNSEWLIFCVIMLLIMTIERLIEEIHEDFTTDEEWNRTDECLPPEPKNHNYKEYNVIVTGMSRATALEYRGAGVWTEDGSGITHYVSYWRELPELPEEVKDERLDKR